MAKHKDKPLVSVVVPMYNEEDNVGATITSLAQQKYDNIQMIVVDDGSTDNSVGIAEQRLGEMESEHLVLENSTNLGQSFSRNRGAMHVKGEYVVFHDADDLSTPDRLRKQVAYLEDNESVGVVGGGYFYVNPSRDQREVKTRPADDASIRTGMARECMVNLGTAMFRREALFETNLFESNNVEGYELIVNVGIEWSLANLSKPIYLYRINDGSRSQQAQLRKKAIIAYRSYQAVDKLNLSYRYLPLQLGWLVYMAAPDELKTVIRFLFSPTTERSLSEEEKRTVQRLEAYE